MVRLCKIKYIYCNKMKDKGTELEIRALWSYSIGNPESAHSL